MRNILATLVVVAIVFMAVGASAADPVKIGMITTLSTKAGYLGEDIRDGFKLAIDQEGGKLGGVPVELLVDDDGADPGQAKQIADRYMKKGSREDHDRHRLLQRGPGRGPQGRAQRRDLRQRQRRSLGPGGQGLPPQLFQRVPIRTTTWTRSWASTPRTRASRASTSSPPTIPRARTIWPVSSATTRARSRARCTPSSARPTTPRKSPPSARPSPRPCSSSCPAAWASTSSSSTPRPV